MPTIATSAPSASPVQRRLHWGRWLVGILLLVGLGSWALLTFWLDPWLQRQAEQRVYAASRGRYRLHIGQLRTQLWPLGATVRAVRLRTVGAGPDSAGLPRLEVALGRGQVRGVSWLALLRRAEVPVDSLTLDSVAVRLQELPQTKQQAPLYTRLPVDGIRLGKLTIRHLHGAYGPAARPTVATGATTLLLHDVRLSAAGAADSARIGYAAQVAAQVRGLAVQLPGHTLQLRRLQISSRTRQLLLDSLVLHPTRPISPQRTATIRASLALPRLQLTGLRLPQLVRRQFRADSLRLTAPRLAVTLPAQKPPSLHTMLAPYLRVCQLQALVVANGNLRVAGTELAPVVAAIQLTGFRLQVLPRPQRPTDLYYAQRWQLQTGATTAALNSPYYGVAWQGLRADTRAGLLRLTDVLVLPMMSVVELARRKGHQAAHVTARLPVLQLSGFDARAAVNRAELRATELAIRGARVTTRSDGRFPINPRRSVVTPEALGKLPFRFALNRLRIAQTTITMIYRAPREATPGTMQITRFGGTLRNASNDPRRMGPNNPLTGEATGRLQNQCVARLTLRANLLDPAGRHTVAGTFGAAPLAILNSMTVPTRGLSFRSGQVEQIRFQMTLDRQAARGTMWGRYTDLKLQRLNRQNRPGVLHRIETTLINGLVIRDNNPRRPGKALKPGKINSARELRYSVFSLWRQGLVSGLLNSAGVPAGIAKKLSEAE
ncbi:AsmA family protein [Hymenobacter pini]|uniref:hypothetical protein n=1 Tax=Hymenobacter pini TaxID=2880879 RepID=UPI001CF53DC5|nr:hypothetical protein [Hymenobacter pini]MCA8831070.1 hypothetical protein [Hymenobacter pini]